MFGALLLIYAKHASGYREELVSIDEVNKGGGHHKLFSLDIGNGVPLKPTLAGRWNDHL